MYKPKSLQVFVEIGPQVYEKDRLKMHMEIENKKLKENTQYTSFTWKP